MGNGGSGGASHGGYGGNGKTRAGGVVTYGLVGSPTDLGSGGGCDYDKRGGQGGGAVKLAIGGDLVVNGDVLANGGNGVGGNGNGSGGGSGGSIWIDAGEISGSGSISAVIFIIFISFSVGLITGIYPAKRAKKISALNALRYE
jgi:ABC-type antimicrobial peptide transport system permease subunit